MEIPQPNPTPRADRARRQTSLVIQVMLLTNTLIFLWVLFGR